jgi:cardiolipin synthase A/B
MSQGVYYALWVVLGFAAILHLLLHKREPISTLSWGLFILLVPLAGPAIYFAFGSQRLVRQASKRKKQILAPVKSHLPKHSANSQEIKLGTKPNFFRFFQKVSEFPPSDFNQVLFLHDPQEALTHMISAIEQAKSYVHLEYYIIASDAITENIFEALIQARNRGVEVRVLYDSFGSLSLKRLHFLKLKRAGISVSGFLPFSLMPQRLNLNFRNHRKILIIDGKTAFTGGTNLGKEYLGKTGDHQWRDFSIQLWGPVCLQLQEIFRKDWSFTTKETLLSDKYFPASEPTGSARIQVLESGPDAAFHNLHHAIFWAISSAKKQVSIMTPYFIPDGAMMAALEVAALRGIDLKIVLPQKNDQPLVKWASRSYYSELLKSGVKIYEFEPKVLHAKLLTVDDEFTLIGSGNMDIRSFKLNFEVTLIIQDSNVNQQAQTLFDNDLRKSNEILLEKFQKRGLIQEITENTCRILGPIL